jgi:hypothetical protein
VTILSAKLLKLLLNENSLWVIQAPTLVKLELYEGYISSSSFKGDFGGGGRPDPIILSYKARRQCPLSWTGITERLRGRSRGILGRDSPSTQTTVHLLLLLIIILVI